MPPEDLKEMARKRPFVPFRMFLTDGTIYDIKHPDLIMPGKRSAVIGFTADPSQTLYDRTTIVDLLHIIRMEPLDVPVTSNGAT